LSARSYLGTAAAAALLAAAPLVAFLTTNRYPLASPEAALLLAACAGAGALLGLAAFLGATAAALVLGAGAALALDLLFGLHTSKLAALAVVLVCLALRRHIAVVIIAAFSVLLATSALARDAPPVLLHVILDEHIGIDGLPPEMAESADIGGRLTGFYAGAGFRLYTGAFSEYFDTRNSIANLVNFASSDDDWAHLAEGRRKPYLLTDSAYFRHLAALGYRLHVYQSDYLDFCQVPAAPYAACFRYRANSIGALVPTTLGTLERARFIFNSFVASSSYLTRVRVILGHHAVSRVGPVAVLPVLQRLGQDLRRATPGQAYLAHLLIPHYPYVLDEGCRLREPIGEWLYNGVWQDSPAPNTAASRAERYRKYFAQIRCQQALLGRLFDALRDAGVWRDAIVVVHGDHGSRIVRHTPVTSNAARLTPQDFSDAFSTLFAVRRPGLEAGVTGSARPLQELLGEAVGFPVEPLAPKVYLRSDDGRLITPLPRDRSPAPQ